MRNTNIKIKQGEYLICTVDAIESNYRTYDMKLFDLANSSEVTDAFSLLYAKDRGTLMNERTYEECGKQFAWYLAFFNGNECNERYNYLIQNPTVRVLVTCEKLRGKVEPFLLEMERKELLQIIKEKERQYKEIAAMELKPTLKR